MEVFLQRVEAEQHDLRFLHVRGGVSYNDSGQRKHRVFSPRAWRCFLLFERQDFLFCEALDFRYCVHKKGTFSCINLKIQHEMIKNIIYRSLLCHNT